MGGPTVQVQKNHSTIDLHNKLAQQISAIDLHNKNWWGGTLGY